MTIEERISAFVKLGESIGFYLKNDRNNQFFELIENSVIISEQHNPWFTKENVLFSLQGICQFLSGRNLKKWLADYPKLTSISANKKVGVIMAGNIPLVGFHDMLCVLISGNTFLGKVSSKDNILLKAITTILISIEGRFKEKIFFIESNLKDFDAVIATGSNNTSRYFESYFGKYPNIIRRNRNSIAVLSGNETEKDLQNLGKDIFAYFGLGCRNVSKIYIPKEYEIAKFIKQLESYKEIAQHSKYFNNYEYNKAIYLVNSKEHLDNGFMLFAENPAIASPISVVYYEYYNKLEDLKKIIKLEKENIQCIVSTIGFENEVSYGQAQLPELWDYADGVDTLKFLENLS